jgi:aminoglycoside phosphotransferase (APT) family kinase protein
VDARGGASANRFDMTAPDGELASWSAEMLALDSARFSRVSSGNSRQTWLVGAADEAEWARWILRVDLSPEPDAPYSLAGEGHIYRGLNRVQALVSPLIGQRRDGRALLFERARGESDLQRLDGPARRVVLVDFLQRLAEIHRYSLDDLGLANLTDGGDVASCVGAEVHRWERLMRASPAPPDPLLEFGHRWLLANLPSTDRAPILVHGDAGPGNFLYEGGHTTAIIDWEFAHAGEAMEDLAWVSLRAAFDSVPGLDEVLLSHCRAHGVEVDDTRLRFYQVLVLWRVLIIRHQAIGDVNRNLGRNIYYRLMHRRLFIDVLMRSAGLVEPDIALSPQRTSRSWLYDACVHHLKETALPSVSGDSQARLAGLIRVLRYLSIWDGNGSVIDDAMTRSLPGGVAIPDSEVALAQAIRAGQISDERALPAIAALVITEHELCRGLLGADADTRLAGLPRT